MNGRKAKQARRTMKALFPDASTEREHFTIQHRYVDFFDVSLGRKVRFEYTTSTIRIRARNTYQGIKKTIRAGGVYAF